MKKLIVKSLAIIQKEKQVIKNDSVNFMMILGLSGIILVGLIGLVFLVKNKKTK